MLFVYEIIIILLNCILESFCGQIVNFTEQCTLPRKEFKAVIKQRIIIILILLPLVFNFRDSLILGHLIYSCLSLDFFLVFIEADDHGRKIAEFSYQRKEVRTDAHWLQLVRLILHH